jgi:hypothetical protein
LPAKHLNSQTSAGGIGVASPRSIADWEGVMTDFLIPRGRPGDSVGARLGTWLTARGIEPSRVRIEFVDQNGAKGGRAVRCAADVTLARHPSLHVECVDTTPRRAFEAVLESLDRRLLRFVGRLRDRARRPKKYFAAKRLLTGSW